MTSCLCLLFSVTLASSQPQCPPHGQTAQGVAVPEPSAKAMEYYRSGNVLWLAWQAMGLAIPAVLLFSGLSARMRDLARWLGRYWFFIVVVYSVFYALADFALRLPLAYYAGFVRQHEYGLSIQTLGAGSRRRCSIWAWRWSSACWSSGFPIG